LLQQDLANILNSNNKVISRYERDEMKPSIEVALKLAKELQTSVGYLLGEIQNHNDPEFSKRYWGRHFWAIGYGFPFKVAMTL
jgi:transcriptional regulator with XRE-family HTH domain